MSGDVERIPVDEAPDWVQWIVSQEEALPEELAKAKKTGQQVYHAIKSKDGSFRSFMICFDQETGEPTDIVWL